MSVVMDVWSQCLKAVTANPRSLPHAPHYSDTVYMQLRAPPATRSSRPSGTNAKEPKEPTAKNTTKTTQLNGDSETLSVGAHL